MQIYHVCFYFVGNMDILIYFWYPYFKYKIFNIGSKVNDRNFTELIMKNPKYNMKWYYLLLHKILDITKLFKRVYLQY